MQAIPTETYRGLQAQARELVRQLNATPPAAVTRGNAHYQLLLRELGQVKARLLALRLALAAGSTTRLN